MKLKKYIFISLLIFFILIAVTSSVDTISATKYKKIDQGKINGYNGVLVKYVTYHNGKTVKMFNKVYIKNKNKYKQLSTMNIYLTKNTKTKLKIRIVSSSKGVPDFKHTFYEKTRLSAKSFYKKNISPNSNYGSFFGFEFGSSSAKKTS